MSSRRCRARPVYVGGQLVYAVFMVFMASLVYYISPQGASSIRRRSAGVRRGYGVHGVSAAPRGSDRVLSLRRSHVLHSLHHALPPGGALPRLRIGEKTPGWNAVEALSCR